MSRREGARNASSSRNASVVADDINPTLHEMAIESNPISTQ